MKITVNQLRRIIKEEIKRVTEEADIMKQLEKALEANPEAAEALASAQPQEIEDDIQAAAEAAEEAKNEAYLREAFLDDAEKVGRRAIRNAGGAVDAGMGVLATGAAGGGGALGIYAGLAKLIDFLGTNSDPMLLGDPLKWAAAAGALAAAGITGVAIKKAAKEISAKQKAKKKESFNRSRKLYNK